MPWEAAVGSSFLLGFQMQPPTPIVGKKYLIDSLHGRFWPYIKYIWEGQEQVAAHGKGILGQFSRPFQGSEHLPQTFIQDWLATWLLFFFSASLPSEARTAL